jgi:uncharacterized protein YbjQ (UPF0145 family)
METTLCPERKTTKRRVYMKPGKINVCLLMAACLLMIVLAGCAAVSPLLPHDSSRLPPILEQDEVIRTYVKLGRIQIIREVYMSDAMVTPDIREWGFSALRREAAKMGADAVIFPEVTGGQTMAVVLPSTEYRATGVAIRFK